MAMADRVIRAEDNGQPLLDADGVPFAELEVDSVDALDEASATVAELAALQREWRFGHVIVDEAQDLTPMQWRMVARRAIGGSMTIVGDLAQRSTGEQGTWSDHLPESLADASHAELTVNYRSPVELSGLAAAILSDLAPHLAPPKAIRSSGFLPEVRQCDDLESAVGEAINDDLRSGPEGRIAVIGFDLPETSDDKRVSWLSPAQAKGLEFDNVIIVEPSRFLDEPRGLSLLYVAITRATNKLTLLHQRRLPAVIETGLAVGVSLGELN